MTSKKRKRATAKASKTGVSRAEGSRTKLAEAFIADLDRSWQRHGREALDRVLAERPEVYFKALVKLTVALHRALGKLNDVDRRRNREEVLQRLEQQAGKEKASWDGAHCDDATSTRVRPLGRYSSLSTAPIRHR